MKNRILTIFISMIVASASAQVDSSKSKTVEPSFGFELPPSQQNGYTDSTLKLMPKMQLTEVYLAQLQKLAMSLPYSSFTLDRADSLSTGLDIPTSRYIARKQSSVQKTSENYGDVMRKRLYEIVPYSDKQEIINAILFLQDVNWSVKQIAKK